LKSILAEEQRQVGGRQVHQPLEGDNVCRGVLEQNTPGWAIPAVSIQTEGINEVGGRLASDIRHRNRPRRSQGPSKECTGLSGVCHLQHPTTDSVFRQQGGNFLADQRRRFLHIVPSRQRLQQSS
jgi:hypothetical protein